MGASNGRRHRRLRGITPRRRPEREAARELGIWEAELRSVCAPSRQRRRHLSGSLPFLAVAVDDLLGPPNRDRARRTKLGLAQQSKLQPKKEKERKRKRRMRARR